MLYQGHRSSPLNISPPPPLKLAASPGLTAFMLQVFSSFVRMRDGLSGCLGYFLGGGGGIKWAHVVNKNATMVNSV